jgi:hypothetical protein
MPGNVVPTIRKQSQRDSQPITLQPPILFMSPPARRKQLYWLASFADGLIAADFPSPESLSATLENAIAGARKAGRNFERMPFIMEGPVRVLRSGERLNFKRVLGITQRFVMLVYKWFATVQVPANSCQMPPALHTRST